MRLHLPDEKYWWEYEAGDAIAVDVAYRKGFDTEKVEPKLKEGVVLVGRNEKITCMVGSGEKVHKASGILVSIDDQPFNWSGEHWFAVRPKCQEYRGRGHNWFYVSQPRAVWLEKDHETVTCSKC
jgi:hypothetical protein|tara:strand:+ start:885 stop:1259 length:375 start_codon:yes stop_codon:yes gene_type:complete